MGQKNSFILKGDICYSGKPDTLAAFRGGYLVCVEGKSGGVFSRLPERFRCLPVKDHSSCLIIPGLVDLHMHAPQFAFRGLGMDMELLDWLKEHAFKEEAKYADAQYARTAYTMLVEHLKQGPNTRVVIFATLHTKAAAILMDLLESSGLVAMAGKVNMDRNSPPNLCEKNAASSLTATEEWLAACKHKNVRPILTPRFIPTCSDELMRGLAVLQKKHNLPLQSHLSENRREIEWVRELRPTSSGYGAAYRDDDLFGGDVPTLMAHCTWSDEKETSLMAERQVVAVHCPQSNTNLSSGIAPVRRFLQAGVPVGLGSDVAGGAHCSIFRAMSDAIQVSKLRRPLLNIDEKALTLEEAFYLGTVSGGAFFARNGMGACGSFEAGYDLDALVIDDGNLAPPFKLSIRDRLERVVYLSDDRNIKAKYVKGKAVKFKH
jgi:guanine deaminase